MAEGCCERPRALDGGDRAPSSGKNSRNFHTLGYEMGNLQKLVFLHTQKVLFHTLEKNFIP
jgi:hypothetical protein